MPNIKAKTLTFTVKVTVGCTEPEAFKDQNEFDNNDLASMKTYIKEKVLDSLTGAWQYAAKVERVTITPVKTNS